MGVRARWPWEGGGLEERPDRDPTANRPPGTPATPDMLGAGALVDLDPDDGREAMLRGRDVAAQALQTETANRGYPYSWDQCRDRASNARDRAHRRATR